VDGTRVYYAERNKSVRERCAPFDFTHMWNLGNKMDEHRGREKKKRRKESKRLLTIGNKLRIATEGWAKWVMGIKEGTGSYM